MEDKRNTGLVDLSKDFNASIERIEALKNGRHVDDIPLYDEYWKAIKKHRASKAEGKYDGN